MKQICNKKQYPTKNAAKRSLNAIIKRSDKRPDREELSIYKCDICGFYHLASKPSEYTPLVLKTKSYFEIQKEKWGLFLQKHSYKRARF